MKISKLDNGGLDESYYTLDYERIIANLKSNGNYFLVEGDNVGQITNELVEFSMNQITTMNASADQLQIQYFSKQKGNGIVNDDNYGIIFIDDFPFSVITNFRDDLNYSCIQSFQNTEIETEKLSSQPQLMGLINNYFDSITNKFANKNGINNEYNTLYFRVEYNTLSLSDFANSLSDYSIYQLVFADLCIVGFVLVKNCEDGFLVNKYEFKYN